MHEFYVSIKVVKLIVETASACYNLMLEHVTVNID